MTTEDNQATAEETASRVRFGKHRSRYTKKGPGRRARFNNKQNQCRYVSYGEGKYDSRLGFNITDKLREKLRNQGIDLNKATPALVKMALLRLRRFNRRGEIL